jgi:hypothetical protein
MLSFCGSKWISDAFNLCASSTTKATSRTTEISSFLAISTAIGLLIIKINQTPIAHRTAAAAHFFILSQTNHFFTPLRPDPAKL